MISLQLKKSTSVKLSDHIAPYLAQIYSPQEFKSELNTLDKLRDSALGVSANASGRDVLFRYFAQLELLSLHVPTSPLKIEFEWRDLYSKKSQKQSSLAFEKACVLFNLGACLSVLASEACQSHDYKTAYHDYCCAAGVFNLISTSFLHPASVDIQPATVSVLSKLMLAQAQHCFFLKAAFPQTSIKANMGLLAKLGMAACSLYEEAIQGLTKLYDEERWGDKQFVPEIEVILQELRAQTYHCSARYFETQHKYGDAIALLHESRRLTTEKRDADEIQHQIKKLEKDNDLIYHERVPSTLPVIPETVSAKALPLSSIYPQEEASNVLGRDIFEKVVPLKVHEKASLYSEMAAQFLRDQQEKTDIANLELESALEYMDLPASIARLRVRAEELGEVPSEVLEYSATVRRSAPLNEADFQFDEQRRRILAMANSDVKEKLVAAGRTDKDLLAMYHKLVPEIDGLKSLDKLVASYRAATRPSLNLLDLDDTDLDAELGKVGALVAKLNKIKTERQSTLADLRQKVHDDDLIQTIVANQNCEDIVTQVFEPQLRKFDPLVLRLDATARLQKSVLNECVASWKSLLDTPAAKRRQEEQLAAQEAIDRLTSDLTQTFRTFEAASSGIQDAKRFYDNLERQALNPSAPVVPARPPVPPKPARPDGLSGYETPSAYNPSMYHQ